MLGISLEQGFSTPSLSPPAAPGPRTHCPIPACSSHRHGKPLAREYRIQRSDGHYLWILDKVSSPGTARGRPCAWWAAWPTSAPQEANWRCCARRTRTPELVLCSSAFPPRHALARVLQLVAHAAQEACGASETLVEDARGDALVSQACAGQRCASGRPLPLAIPALARSAGWPAGAVQRHRGRGLGTGQRLRAHRRARGLACRCAWTAQW